MAFSPRFGPVSEAALSFGKQSCRSTCLHRISATGVDPLASNKGFWAEVLGVGDFYYELGVKIVDICMATRPVNGGLIDVTVRHPRFSYEAWTAG